jgi:pyruvate dehydrogenase E1 component
VSDITAHAGQAARSEITPAQLETLQAIERRVLWLAVRIVDYANRERPKDDELKVGGHQASSASMVSLMTALYFWDLGAADRVSVKPHASPVLHAIEYLLGRLPREYLTTLRAYGGLQSYPSRTKDPFAVDYSTGSVGLGAAAPLFGALVRRYVDDHFGPRQGGGRFIYLLGEAELDEGNHWEAVFEPSTRVLGNALWVVDLNRQSLDRVVPIIKAAELERQFETAGWQVIELKYGRRLREAYGRHGGDLLRRRIDEMPNQVYQGLFGASEEVVAEALQDGLAPGDRARLGALLDAHRGRLASLVFDLGGHDLADLVGAFARAAAEPHRPTVIFAYTIKGFGLPIAGRPMNHSAALSGEQIDSLREASGLTPAAEWDAFEPDSPEGRLCAEAARRLTRPPAAPRGRVTVPEALGAAGPGRTSTQAAFGQALLGLSRVDGLAERMVTLSPDVSVSTNLGGWINKVGIWGAPEPDDRFALPDDSPLRWSVSPQGRHIELGISEMNLFLLLGQLGLAGELSGEQLFAVGTVYDPFVVRGLEALLYSVYSGSRFVFAGTPSGVSLSREGGAHQSTITPGIGIELPGLTYAEPAYAREMEWLLLSGLARLDDPGGEALYLRLSTKPVDQAPFAELCATSGEDSVRRDVLAGGFRLREPGDGEELVVLATCGAMTPETLEAARLLEGEGVAAAVLCLSSPDRLYRGWRESRLTHLRDLRARRIPSQLERLVPPAERGAPVVTIIDGASHALAFLGGCLGVRLVPLGADTFGQAGSLAAVYEAHDLSPEAIATAALIALEP